MTCFRRACALTLSIMMLQALVSRLWQCDDDRMAQTLYNACDELQNLSRSGTEKLPEICCDIAGKIEGRLEYIRETYSGSLAKLHNREDSSLQNYIGLVLL